MLDRRASHQEKHYESEALPLRPCSILGCMEDQLCMTREVHGTIPRQMLSDPWLVQC